MLTVDIQQHTAGDALPSEQQLAAWARSAYLTKSLAAEVEVSVSVMDSDTMQKLNRDYRGKASPTNVLAFPGEPPHLDSFQHLGDIVLCADVIAHEATEQKKQPDSHWAHMVIHGMLHLQGYDHIDSDDAKVMESTEIELLKQLGYSNPYN